jgi:iron complex transport system substrate-binding protein
MKDHDHMNPFHSSTPHAAFKLNAALLILSFGLVSCVAQAEPTPGPQLEAPASLDAGPLAEITSTPTIAVVDQRGVEIILDKPAIRIISMAPSNTELLFAIGAGNQMVGRDEISDYPSEALEIESIGSTYGELNTEAIISLDPDLMLAADLTPPEQIKELEDLGYPVFQVPNPDDFEHLFKIIVDLGKLTGHPQEADDLAAELAGRVARVESALDGAQAVKLFYEVDGSDPTAPWTTGSGTFQDFMIRYAAGENIAADIQGWGQMTVEEIVARDPDVIIFASGPWVPTTAETFAGRAGWADIAAVKSGRIFPIDTNWIDRPGPRLIDALEFMAGSLHPDRVQP